MIQTRNIILKIYIISFPIYELSRLLDMQELHIARKIEQNSSGTRLTFCFILKLETTQFYFLLFVFIRCTNPCHWLSLTVTCYDSLSFIVTRCHSFSLDLSLVVIRCLALSFVAPLVVIRCTTRCHSLPLVVPLVATRFHSMYHSSVFL